MTDATVPAAPFEPTEDEIDRELARQDTRRGIAIGVGGAVAVMAVLALVWAAFSPSQDTTSASSGSDAEYIALVRGAGALPGVDDHILTAIGHQTCTALRDGADLQTTMRLGTDAGFPAGQVATVNGLAVQVFCPDQTEHVGIHATN